MAKREEKLTFEQGLAQLEALVHSLEEGKLSLDESFQAYESGARLLKRLEAQLGESEAKIRLLTEDGERPLSEEVT